MSAFESAMTSDFRAAAQDYKRDANRKYTWTFGEIEREGTAAGHPCPGRVYKPNDQRKSKCTQNGRPVHSARRYRGPAFDADDVVVDDVISTSCSSTSDGEDMRCNTCMPSTAPPRDAGVMYSFDAARAPTHGSQILNSALAEALAKFEEKETVKLVKSEYDVLDSAGESVAVSPVKKGKGKAAVAAKVESLDEEDYEFV